MARQVYSDKELSSNKQVFFLENSGFLVKVVFGPSDFVFFKRKYIQGFLEVWDKGGFLVKPSKKVDFAISLEEKIKIDVIKKKKKKEEEYRLSLKKDFANGKVTTYYHQGLLSFQFVLKEALAYVLDRNNGLLLHASSCLDSKGNLKVFFAPSGGGKTTTVSMLTKSGYKSFGDDLLIVRRFDGKWRYFSPPFVEKNLLPKKQVKSSATLFFIKKSRSFSKVEIVDKGRVLKFLLKQVWTREEKIGEKLFKNIVDFAKGNRFYYLHTKLDPKGLRKVINEG